MHLNICEAEQDNTGKMLSNLYFSNTRGRKRGDAKFEIANDKIRSHKVGNYFQVRSDNM